MPLYHDVKEGHSMRQYSEPGRLRRFLQRIKRYLTKPEPELPEDPYAYVGAPKKPRPPHRSSASAAPLD
jgi:hypothetical protein